MSPVMVLMALALATTSLSVSAEPVVSAGGRLVFRPAAGAESLAARLAMGADADRDSVARELGRSFDEVVDVRIAVEEASRFEGLPPGVVLPAWVRATAFPHENLIVLKAGSQDEAHELLRHELLLIEAAHLSSGQAPHWFLEGLSMVRTGARWRSEGPSLAQAASAGRLHRLASLERGFPAEPDEALLAYAQSAEFVSWLIERRGETAVQELLRSVAAGVPFPSAAVTHLGAPVRELEQRWSMGLVRWEVLWRALADSPLRWGVPAAVIALAILRLRRRRQWTSHTGGAEDEEDRRLPEHVFSMIPAVWADIPTPVDPVPHRDDLAPSVSESEVPNAGASDAHEGEGEESRSLLAMVSQPRKPTIH
jgi:hypothetical protein